MAGLPQRDDWKRGSEDDVAEIRNCLCPNCGGGNAVTVMLPTEIPLFREIIIMSLTCEDCNFRNSEVNFGGEIQEQGERLQLQVHSDADLNRQLIKSDSASLMIPQLELEIPPQTQRGTISTLEGFLLRAKNHIEAQQPERLRLGDVDGFHRCRVVIRKLRQFVGDDDNQDNGADDDSAAGDNRYPFDVLLDDPAGNSFIENPHAPLPDPHMTSTKYHRTPTQDMTLGLQPSRDAVAAGVIDDANPTHKNPVNVPAGSHTLDMEPKHDSHLPGSFVRQEVMKFATQCPHCFQPAETDMCVTEIPHFKEVIIMSLVCEECGFRSNEIKGGGAIPRYGSRITLCVRDVEDLAREVLKSDTAGLEIPELELVLEDGGLDGMYTTVESLLKRVHSRLEMANPFVSGDAATKQHLSNDGETFSAPSANHARYIAFLTKLKDMANGNILPFTLIIPDPLANSFVGPVPKDAMSLARQAEREGNNTCYNDYVDNGLQVEEYERSFQDNEKLGLNDLKTENYQELADGKRHYYGTDAMEELSDRLRRPYVRGPDHPLEVGKAPIEGDTTNMGAGTVRFAADTGMTQRGKLFGPGKPAENVAFRNDSLHAS